MRLLDPLTAGAYFLEDLKDVFGVRSAGCLNLLPHPAFADSVC